jgi:predicted ATPase
VVGREAEREQLHRWPQQTQDGTPELVFVTGEAGPGKTAVWKNSKMT